MPGTAVLQTKVSQCGSRPNTLPFLSTSLGCRRADAIHIFTVEASKGTRGSQTRVLSVRDKGTLGSKDSETKATGQIEASALSTSKLVEASSSCANSARCARPWPEAMCCHVAQSRQDNVRNLSE